MFQDDSFQKAVRDIKINGHHMKKAFETGNMKETLKYTREMLSSLSLDEIGVKNYYQVFLLCFNELASFQDSLGQMDFTKKKYDIYEIVQYSKTILPRLYLLISVGTVLIFQKQKDILIFLQDVFKMCKGVQHPCRGLFLRFYFLKIFKQIFEKQETQSYAIDNKQILLDLLLKNLKEMNSLWIRINNLVDDKIVRKQSRKDLGMIVADNLMQISMMPGMSLEFYKENVLDNLLNIILENQDKISQSFLFDILLDAFPVEYHIPTLEKLLSSTERIYKKVNLNQIYLKIMERFTEFAKNNTNDNQNEDMNFIYDAFNNTLKNIFSKNKYSLSKCLSLISGFMNFTANFYKNNLTYINDILKMTNQLCEQASQEELNNKNSILNLEQILSTPLESLSILILNIDEFPKLMNILPINNQNQVISKICQGIATSQIFIVNQSIMSKLVIFIEPLFNKENSNQVEKLAEILRFIESPSPLQNLKMLEQLYDQTDSQNKLHVKNFYPQYIYQVIRVINKCSQYQLMNQNQEIDLNQNILQQYPQLFNPPYLQEEDKNINIQQEDYQLNFEEILEKLHLINFEIEIDNPLIALQIYLDLSLSLDQQLQSENLDQILYSCYSRISNIFQNDIGNQKQRLFHFNKIIGYLSQLNNINQETFLDIVGLFRSSISLLGNRGQQARMNLKISKLLLGNEFELKNCISRALKLIQMASKYDKKELSIYINSIDYILEYMNKGVQCFQLEELQQALNIVNQKLQDMKKKEYQLTEEFIKNQENKLDEILQYWRERIQNQEILEIIKVKEQLIQYIYYFNLKNILIQIFLIQNYQQQLWVIFVDLKLLVVVESLMVQVKKQKIWHLQQLQNKLWVVQVILNLIYYNLLWENSFQKQLFKKMLIKIKNKVHLML